MPANTGEDAQPNEIRLSRKGAGVPPIRSSNVSAGSRGRGRGRGWRGPFNIQRPSKQPAVSSYRASPMQEQAEEDSRTPRSPVEHAIPAFHHKRPRKRRRIEDKNDASHAPGKQISTSSSSNQFHATRKEKPNKEYVDFSVHLPHSCRKGAPNCNKFRQDWINKNKKMLQKQHGLRFIQYMICDESIFFTFLKNSSGCPVAEGGNVANVSTDPISLATGLHRTSSEETHTQGDGDVAGSTIVNVTGHGLREEVCHSEHASVLLDPNLSLQEEIIDLTGDSDDIAGRGQDVGLYGDTTSAIEDSVGDISRERGVQCLGSKRESPATLLSTSKWESKKLRIQLLSPTDDPTSSSDFSSPNAPPQGVVHAQMPYVLSNVTARGVPAAPALGERVHHSSRGLERETGRKRLLLPKHRHDKPRRLMFSRSLNSGPVMFYAVTMHGFLYSVPAFQCVTCVCLRYPEIPRQEFIDDACLLNIEDRDVVLLAHARERKEISLLDVTYNKVRNLVSMDRPIRPGKEPDKKTGNGVSAVCPLRHSGDFATGGHDHSVHLWSLRDVTSLRYSTPTLLSINHTSMIQSLLAIRDTSHKLVSAGADCAVRMWDMSSERVVRSFKVSNSVYHVHELENPFCTLLEVAHRDQQFEIHDHRLVPEKPVQRFGYASIHTHGRYIKGDIQSSNFACGDREGSIHLWDLRNTQATALSMSCFPGCKVVQVTFSSRERLTACSEDSEITTLDLGTGNS